MKNKKIVFLTMLLISTLWFGCSSNKKEENKTIKIGAILPLTGSSANAAKQIKEGISLAAKKFENEYKDLKVQIFYGDSKNNAKDGLLVYKRLKNINNIKYFLASNSGVVVPLIQSVKKDKDVVLFTTVNSAAGVPQAGDNIFRLFVSVENEAKRMIEFVKNKLNKKNIAILYINDDFGLSGYKTFISYANKNKIKIIFSESFKKNGINFKNIVIKIPKSAECIYVIGYDKAFGTIIKQIREFGYKGLILTTIGLSVKPWRDLAGNAAIAAYYTAANFSVANPSKFNRSFINSFVPVFKKQPTSFNAFGYDSAMMLFLSIQKSLVNNGNLNKILLKLNYTGAFGKIKFDKNGEADLPLSIYKWTNNGALKVE